MLIFSELQRNRENPDYKDCKKEKDMKKKRIISLLLCLVMLGSLCIAFAANDTSRVAIGADLNESQIQGVYQTFGINRGDVKELKVTNFDEMRYLSDVVDQTTIGTRAISCIYIETKDEGEGLNVTTNNINWCTPATYRNALVTAGVNDADVKITAPFPVSGTAALTGIFLAYEDLTGEPLDEQAKIVGTEELAISSDLANQIGDENTSNIVNDLKGMVGETKNMTDEQLRITIINIATIYNVTLTEEQITNLIVLVRQLETVKSFSLKVKISTNKNKQNGTQSASLEADQQQGESEEADDSSRSFGDKIADIWEAITMFFRNLFTKGEN